MDARWLETSPVYVVSKREEPFPSNLHNIDWSLYKIDGQQTRPFSTNKMLADAYALIGHEFVFQHNVLQCIGSIEEWLKDNDLTVLD